MAGLITGPLNPNSWYVGIACSGSSVIVMPFCQCQQATYKAWGAINVGYPTYGVYGPFASAADASAWMASNAGSTAQQLALGGCPPPTQPSGPSSPPQTPPTQPAAPPPPTQPPFVPPGLPYGTCPPGYTFAPQLGGCVPLNQPQPPPVTPPPTAPPPTIGQLISNAWYVGWGCVFDWNGPPGNGYVWSSVFSPSDASYADYQAKCALS